MNIQELFNACAQQGAFPMVQSSVPIKHAESNIGRVVTIGANGVAVRFPGLKYDSWFWSDSASDGRSKYMHHLSLIQ